MSGAPFFSIITAIRRPDEQRFRALARSIGEQTTDDLEWVVQDGGSDVALLAEIAGSEARLRLVSAPDDGIYDAFNRAIDRARGRWIVFLGADDRLADPGVLQRLRQRIEATDADVVLAAARYDGGQVVVSSLGLMTAVRNTVHHQGACYRHTLFDGYRYPTDVPVIADYDLSYRLRHERRGALVVDEVLAECSDGGVSRTTAELPLYLGMHLLRSRRSNRAVSAVCLAVGLANVARRHAAVALQDVRLRPRIILPPRLLGRSSP